MKNKFKFSLVILTYNNSKFLSKQLKIIFQNLKKIIENKKGLKNLYLKI